MGQLDKAVGDNWKTQRRAPKGGAQQQDTSGYHTVNGYLKSEVVSALQKCIRRNNEPEALYWAAELLASGAGYHFWRRIAAITAEDVGLADPDMPARIAALNDLARINQEWNIPFMAVMLLCRAPKNREADDAAWLYEVRRKEGWKIPIPREARDGHTIDGKAKLYQIARETGESFDKVWGREFYYDAALLSGYVPVVSDKLGTEEDYYRRRLMEWYKLPYETYELADCPQPRMLTGPNSREHERAFQKAVKAELDFHQMGDENGEPIPRKYKVRSFDPENQETFYEVDLTPGSESCTCPAFDKGHGGWWCKHMLALDRQLQNEGEG